MVFEKFVSIGGVVFSEAHQKPMAVVNVISLNRLGKLGRRFPLDDLVNLLPKSPGW